MCAWFNCVIRLCDNHCSSSVVVCKPQAYIYSMDTLHKTRLCCYMPAHHAYVSRTQERLPILIMPVKHIKRTECMFSYSGDSKSAFSNRHHGISHSLQSNKCWRHSSELCCDMGAYGAQITSSPLHHVHAYSPDGSRLPAQVLLHLQNFSFVVTRCAMPSIVCCRCTAY